MANTTLQNLIATLRGANILPAAKVNYGIVDKLAPPYISVRDYEHRYEYQAKSGTPGATKFKFAKFNVLVVDKSQDTAEDIASQVDALLQFSTTATPTCDRVWQESYKVGQLEFSPQLYQYGVEIGYEMTENES